MIITGDDTAMKNTRVVCTKDKIGNNLEYDNHSAESGFRNDHEYSLGTHSEQVRISTEIQDRVKRS